MFIKSADIRTRILASHVLIFLFHIVIPYNHVIEVPCYLLNDFNIITISMFDMMQQADTTHLGLSLQDALKTPYIASMGVYVFRTEILLKLLRWRYPTSNDFGSEVIPAAVMEHNVQVRTV